MAQVNTNNYKEALNYLNNSSTYEQNKAKIISVIGHLDSRILSVVNEDLNKAKETFNKAIEEEKNIKSSILTKIEKYIEIESKARERAGLITGAVIGAAKAPMVNTGITPPIPVMGAVFENPEEEKNFVLKMGNRIKDTGAKFVNDAKSVASSIASLFSKVGDVIVHPKKTISLIKEKLSNAFDWIIETGCKTIVTIYSTLINTIMMAAEGMALLGEMTIKAATSIVGLLTIPYDIGQLIGSKLFKSEFEPITKSVWTKKIMPLFSENSTTKWFDNLYETKFMQLVDEFCWGPMKRDGGTLYEIGKGICYTAGGILITISTAGLGSSSLISSTIMGLGTMGKNISSSYQSMSIEEREDMSKIAETVIASATTGLIEGITWYLTFGKGKDILMNSSNPNKIITAQSKFWNKGVDMIFSNKLTSKLPLEKISNLLKIAETDIGNNVKVMVGESMVSMDIIFLKEYLNKGVTAATESESLSHWAKLTFNGETFKNATINALISLIYDNSLSSSLNPLLDKVNTKLDNTAQMRASATNTEINTNLYENLKMFCDDGIGETAGGFIKTMMDLRILPDLGLDLFA